MTHEMTNRTGPRLRIALLLTAGLAATSAPAANAERTPQVGGISAPEEPKVDDARCLTGCVDIRTAAIGGTISLTGTGLKHAEKVRFPSRNGRRAVGRVVKATDTEARARVPKRAKGGKPVVRDDFGGKARSPVKIEVKPASALSAPADLELTDVQASPRSAFLAGAKPVRVSYTFKAKKPSDIRVDIVHKGTGQIVRSVVKRDQEPFAAHSVRWKGQTDGRRKPPEGRYVARVRPLAGGSSEAAPFRFHGHRFPLPASHTYGDGLGAGRGHQGQDVFARCGAPIYAARGGRVQWSQYQSRAGYYVVIDGVATGRDYAYMHLQRRGRVREGERVRTGQRIGFNGETGNASGCHLHFEIWSAPGWYEGGSPINPTPLLKRWDRWS